MKKKKILIIVLLILVIILIALILIGLKTPIFKKNTNETSRNFILNEATNSTINTHGENAGIYVGTYNEKDDEPENFLFISIKIDKKASKEDQVKTLISEISDATGYTIGVDSVEINGDDIEISLSQDKAPYVLEGNYNPSGKQQYYITAESSEKSVQKVLFDSIDKTMKSYFGSKTEVNIK